MAESRTARKANSTFGSRTDIGSVRDHNEDSLIVAPPLFVVCDGMGGHAAGEVASEIAVDVIADRAPDHPDAQALAQAVMEANLAIIHAAREGAGREGMGTTCTAAILENERLVIAQVGDSRAYLLHQGHLQQVTRDHSLMTDLIEAGQITPEEAKYHPQRSVITRALGSDPAMEPDIYEINVETGDRLLLCSDGLSSMIEDRDIEAILNRTRDPQRCAAQLVNEAIAAGGYDNVTVIVADVTGFAEVRSRRVARRTKITAVVILILLAAIIGGAIYLFNYTATHSAYLRADNGYVAIYRGLQGSLFGMTNSELVEVTNVPIDELQPGLANRLETEGIQVESVESAEELVNSYREEIEAREAQESEAEASRQDRHALDASDSSSSSQSGSGSSSSSRSSSSSTSRSASSSSSQGIGA